MMFGKRAFAAACVLSYGFLATPSFASAWRWQHPGFHGQNGMLDVSVLTKTHVDWAFGSWKGECSGPSNNGVDPVGTRVLQGIAESTDWPPFANAILCTNSDEANGFGWTVDKFNYVTLNVVNQNDQRGSWQQYGDWSFGDYKGECPDGYAVTGIAQTPTYYSQATNLLCSKISVEQPTSCWAVRMWYGNDSRSDWFGWSVGAWYNDYSLSSQDWNRGYFKMSCWADTYVAGVAVSPGSHAPDTLLCCQ